MDPTTPESPSVSTPARQQYDALARKLEDRKSITHFARFFVLSMVSIMAFGVAVRLLVDSARLPYVWFPVALLFFACVSGAVLNYVRGRRLWAEERRDYVEFRKLRTELALDV